MACYGVAIFAEGEFEEIRRFDSLAECDAFSEGCSAGATFYSGSVWAYTLPLQMDFMKAEIKPNEFERAKEAWSTFQKKWDDVVS